MFSKMKAAIAVTLAGMLAMAQQANAALPEAIGTGLSGIQTDALALVDLVWPVVIAITLAFVLFKIFRRGVAKV